MESNQTNEIILYQPDEAMKLEVRLERETVWLTQNQIADLFGTKRPAITKHHLSNIFKSGELDEDSVRSILEHTASDGKVYKTQFYNLDAILSVGYRVNSKNATMFRRWANQILKDYLLRGYSVNQRLMQLEDRIDRQDPLTALAAKHTCLFPVVTPPKICMLVYQSVILWYGIESN